MEPDLEARVARIEGALFDSRFSEKLKPLQAVARERRKEVLKTVRLGVSYKEIAKALGVTRGRVSGLYCAALREEMIDEETVTLKRFVENLHDVLWRFHDKGQNKEDLRFLFSLMDDVEALTPPNVRRADADHSPA
jgi:hypothetical protein